jgi:hypothetical protein
MDSEIIIHFTHNSEKKSENTFILHFLQQFKEKHVYFGGGQNLPLKELLKEHSIE